MDMVPLNLSEISYKTNKRFDQSQRMFYSPFKIKQNRMLNNFIYLLLTIYLN